MFNPFKLVVGSSAMWHMDLSVHYIYITLCCIQREREREREREQDRVEIFILPMKMHLMGISQKIIHLQYVLFLLCVMCTAASSSSYQHLP